MGPSPVTVGPTLLNLLFNESFVLGFLSGVEPAGRREEAGVQKERGSEEKRKLRYRGGMGKKGRETNIDIL